MLLNRTNHKCALTAFFLRGGGDCGWFLQAAAAAILFLQEKNLHFLSEGLRAVKRR